MSISPLILPFQARTFDSASTLRASITGLSFSETATATGTGELQGSTDLTITQTGALVLGRIKGDTSLSFTANATYSTPLRTDTSISIGATATISAKSNILGSTSLSFTATGDVIGETSSRISPLVLPATRFDFSPAIQATKGSTTFSFSTDATLTAKGGLGGNRIFGSTSIDIFTPAFVWLVGKGELAGTADITFSESATIRAEGQTIGATSISFAATANLRGGINALFGGTDLEITNTGNLLGKGQLQGSASITFSDTATMQAKGELKGATNIRFLNPGSLISFISGGTSMQFVANGQLRTSVDTSDKVRPIDSQVRSLRPDDLSVRGRRPPNVAVGGRR